MRVRAEGGRDIAAIAAVHEAAFGSEAEAVLVAALRASAGWIPELSLVAEADGQVVGHVLLTRIDIVGTRPGEALALAPIGVMPGWQRRGIGARLVRQALAEAAALGHQLTVVLGHPAYYPRFGFLPARPLGVLPPFEVPDDAWMALDLAGRGNYPRGTVRYPPAFARL
ncbi:MAG: GNAT family N-acetyltransferase [Egibacteraceae bacterium]